MRCDQAKQVRDVRDGRICSWNACQAWLHAQRCATCAAAFRTTNQLEARLKQEVEDIPPAYLRDRIRAAVETAASEAGTERSFYSQQGKKMNHDLTDGRTERRNSIVRRWSMAGIATSALLGGGAGMWWSNISAYKTSDGPATLALNRTEEPESLEDKLNSPNFPGGFIGKKESDLIRELGPPTRVEREGGSKVLVYEHSNRAYRRFGLLEGKVESVGANAMDWGKPSRNPSHSVEPPQSAGMKAARVVLSEIHMLSNYMTALYARDHQGKLPPMTSSQAFQNAMLPYVNDIRSFKDEATGREYAINPYLTEKLLKEIKNPEEIVAVYEPTPCPYPISSEPVRHVAFLDGHAQMVPERDWPRLKRQSHLE